MRRAIDSFPISRSFRASDNTSCGVQEAECVDSSLVGASNCVEFVAEFRASGFCDSFPNVHCPEFGCDADCGTSCNPSAFTPYAVPGPCASATLVATESSRS